MTHPSQPTSSSETPSPKPDTSRRDVLLGTAVAVSATAAGIGTAAAAKPVRGLATDVEWGKPIEKMDSVPVVFNFKPEKFVVVSPERLKDWEKLFAERVGLKPERAGGLVGMHPDETISGSGNDWDDCDYM